MIRSLPRYFLGWFLKSFAERLIWAAFFVFVTSLTCLWSVWLFGSLWLFDHHYPETVKSLMQFPLMLLLAWLGRSRKPFKENEFSKSIQIFWRTQRHSNSKLKTQRSKKNSTLEFFKLRIILHFISILLHITSILTAGNQRIIPGT